jgi:hypothetical protein
MEKLVSLDYDGQMVLRTDINAAGESAGRADDRVFAEVYRFFNKTAQKKAILPTGCADPTNGMTDSVTTVEPGIGGVYVRPFRAFVSPWLSEPGLTQKELWRGVHTALYVGATDLDLNHVALLNPAGSARIAGIYATINLKSVAATNHKVKDPTSKAIAVVSTVSVQQPSVTVSGIVGPSVGVYPTLPTDDPTNGVYYIWLAYVTLAASFTSGSFLNANEIVEVAPVVQMAPQAGASSALVATANTKVTGIATARNFETTGIRDMAFMPPSFGGGIETLHMVLDLTSASAAAWNIQSGGYVDAQRDYRNRIFRVSAACRGGTGITTPWSHNATYVATRMVPPSYNDSVDYSSVIAPPIVQITSSFQGPAAAGGNVPYGPASYIAYYDNTVSNSQMDGTSKLMLFVDQTDGTMRVWINSVPKCLFYFWIDMTPQYANR